MSGLFDALTIGKSAIFYNQIRMDVTSHNIANAGTEGYSRQRVEAGASVPILTPQGLLGMGVEVRDIVRQRERYIDMQVRNDRSEYSMWNNRYQDLTRIEGILNESSDYGLSTTLDEFWNAWSDLSQNPGDTSYRSQVLAKSEQLCHQFKSTFQSILETQTDLIEDIEGDILRINQLAHMIVDLNRQISSLEAGSTSANDLMDNRDLLIDELSNLVDVNVTFNDSGTVTVMIGTDVLLNDTAARQLQTDRISEADTVQLRVSWRDNGNDLVLKGGSLNTKLEDANSYIPGVIDDLDECAGTLIEQVNAIHSTGYGLDGESTGIEFFTGASAHDIGVQSSLSRDVSLIAASRAAGQGMDNGNALALSSLRDEKVMNEGSMTINEFYSSLIFQVGLDCQESLQRSETGEALMNHSRNLQDSVSGVNLEEEMVELIKYQNAFDAAAKVVSTVDEMLESLISTVG
jgi:flagellar hook-associated protein 1 FlgK